MLPILTCHHEAHAVTEEQFFWWMLSFIKYQETVIIVLRPIYTEPKRKGKKYLILFIIFFIFFLSTSHSLAVNGPLQVLEQIQRRDPYFRDVLYSCFVLAVALIIRVYSYQSTKSKNQDNRLNNKRQIFKNGVASLTQLLAENDGMTFKMTSWCSKTSFSPN